jgi:hypothetical protein
MSNKSDFNLDKFNLIHAPLKTAYRMHNGQIAAVIPEPSDFDCPDCVFVGDCANLSPEVKRPCEIRPDGVCAIYWRLNVINPAPMDQPENLQPAAAQDSEQTE